MQWVPTNKQGNFCVYFFFMIPHFIIHFARIDSVLWPLNQDIVVMVEFWTGKNTSDLLPLLLTWINFNPSMDK